MGHFIYLFIYVVNFTSAVLSTADFTQNNTGMRTHRYARIFLKLKYLSRIQHIHRANQLLLSIEQAHRCSSLSLSLSFKYTHPTTTTTTTQLFFLINAMFPHNMGNHVYSQLPFSLIYVVHGKDSGVVSFRLLRFCPPRLQLPTNTQDLSLPLFHP